MATKSAEQKAIEKRVREEKRHALEAARRERAMVADMIKDFLVSTGIPNDKVFCSSLPGNDVHEKRGKMEYRY